MKRNLFYDCVWEVYKTSNVIVIEKKLPEFSEMILLKSLSRLRIQCKFSYVSVFLPCLMYFSFS